LRWNLSEKSEISLAGSLARSDAGFDPLVMAFAANANSPLNTEYPDLPGPGPDAGPLAFHDYDFSGIDHYSDLDYTEVRTTLGFRHQVRPAFGMFGAVSYYDLQDDEPYLQDATGSVVLLSGGLTWSF
jgi:hypothetical protein